MIECEFVMTKRKDPKDFLKNGRPTLYNEKIADEICAAIASSEKGLYHLVQQYPHWPQRQQIFVWLQKHPEFADKYYKAKENQAEVITDYMQSLVDETHKTVDVNGNVKIDVPLLKLKIDSLRWHASKLKPKRFGEAKVQEPLNNEMDDDIKRRYGGMTEKDRRAES
jgi:hypothetical protein